MADDQQSDSQDDKTSQRLTKKQKIIFCGIAAAYVFNVMSFSIMAPFFPVEAEKKGVSATQVGFIFALFNLVNFATSPLFGKYLPVLGAKYLFLAGSWVAAGSNILFGVLDKIEDRQTFLIYCLVIRSVEACGSAASMTASMTITANTFPNNVAQMMGILESFSGLGLMIGPPIGSLFYSIGGYSLPFYVLGGMSAATIVINIFLLPSVGANMTQSGSIKGMLYMPCFYPAALTIVVGSGCLGFLDPTLSPHLTSFSLSPSLIGVVFLLIGGLYALTQPLWGYLADKKRNTRFMMVIGLWFSTVCYLLLGPSPLLKLPNELWIVIVGIGMTGFCLGCALMPAFLDLFISARWYGYPDDLATQGVVSGLFNSCFSLGGFIGPLLGGYLVDQYNFQWTSTIFAFANLSVMLLLCVFGLWEFRCGKGRRPPWIWLGDSPREEENDPLLGNGVTTPAIQEKLVNA
ncbi:MFS-type transporter SLC18B1-like [Apostichopus japonicus]|uniref:MFS-type transporter SLC18B1-like n=1 Tax=Stichopus japonicus TaxID=307972 RepID=UPI003AB70C38